MRELPEPEGYLCDWGNDSYGLPRIIVYYGEPGSATADDWNESPKVHRNTPIFTREQVLSIQKQAYEDGLRDAGKDAERYRWLRQHQLLAKIHYMPTTPASYLDEAIDIAMLTASQKDQK